MLLFNQTEPIFRRKQKDLDVQDLTGLLRLELQVRRRKLLHRFYTRIDQVFVLWGLVSAAIFLTAQFAPLSWTLQAWLWSGLTLVATGTMIWLTFFWVRVERLQWILLLWSGLMITGVVVTDLGIFLGIGQVLMHLCDLWLGLCAVGYMGTGWGARSRAFLLAGTIHLVGMLLLPYVLGWQFLTTALIMASSLLVFAETQWDMRPPIEDYALLSPEQRQFNQQQQQRRQVVDC
jgi:hypothetical protein